MSENAEEIRAIVKKMGIEVKPSMEPRKRKSKPIRRKRKSIFTDHFARIVERVNSGESQRKIAREFGTHYTSLHDFLTRRGRFVYLTNQELNKHPSLVNQKRLP